MKTRDKILAAALRLFNESGTGAVTTNHIAEALSMSPGNLYYHFRNKDEIIRGLFEQLFVRWDKLIDLAPDQMPTLDDLQRLVRANYTAMFDYRFVYRELIALLRRDAALRARWLAIRERGYAGFHELFGVFVSAGVLRDPGGEVVITQLADLCWLISEFWPASIEVSGQDLDVVQLDRGVALMLQVLSPYIVV